MAYSILMQYLGQKSHWIRNENNLSLSREFCSLWSAFFGIIPTVFVLGSSGSRRLLTLKIGPVCCSEPSSRNYQSSARKIAKPGVCHLHRGRSLKSLNDVVCLPLRWRILQTNRTTVILADRTWRIIHILVWLPESKMNRSCIFIIIETH